MADRFTGTVVLHCHILYHSDGGMMIVGEIVHQGMSGNVVQF